jgi:phosphoglucosamine mutase
MNMTKLFGTDGIRGMANRYPMTPETAVNVGRALAAFFNSKNTKPKIVIGKDTRISGDMLESALIAGICSMGADAYRVGILPTPGIAFMTKDMRAEAGIVISASHNPYYDNGIKVFKGDGFKLTDKEETSLESIILNNDLASKAVEIKKTGRIVEIQDADVRYTGFVRSRFPDNFSFNGMKLVIDCANGAAYRAGPAVFTELGAEVESLFTSPDGININDHCGSQHLDTLAKRVVETGAAAGLAFDGDGDRVVAVDEQGNAVSGDQILAICGKFMLETGSLKNKKLVSTVMSNFGLGIALGGMGIEHIIADVGDRYVLQQMISCGAVLGGEDSGHLIFLNDHTTGDGLLAGVKLIQAMIKEGRPLSWLRKMMQVYPQVLLNVEVAEKPDLVTVSEISESVQSVEARLNGQGRVLVRYSGTQPLCRVMVEGPDPENTEAFCLEITETIRKTIGK